MTIDTDSNAADESEDEVLPIGRIATLRYMIKTVATYEAHLFTEAQWRLWHQLNSASPAAIDLFVRLLQRLNPCSWWRLEELRSRLRKLKQKQSSNSSTFDSSIKSLNSTGTLYLQSSSLVPSSATTNNLRIVSDAVSHCDKPTGYHKEETDSAASYVTAEHLLRELDSSACSLVALGLAEDETQLQAEDALMLLKVDELKLLARKQHIGINARKSSSQLVKQGIVDTILAANEQQISLKSFKDSICDKGRHRQRSLAEVTGQSERPRNTKSIEYREWGRLNESSPKSNEHILLHGDTNSNRKCRKRAAPSSIVREQAVYACGCCIRLTKESWAFFRRIALVYFRATELNDSWMTFPQLSHWRKVVYPRYRVARSASLFATPEALADYEQALVWQQEIVEILEGPRKTEKARLERARSIFEAAFIEWQMSLLDENQDKNEGQSSYILSRFKAGWILTRIVYKGIYLLARSGQYIQEHQVLTLLLAQRKFRRGKRGAWWNRKALIEQRYMYRYNRSEREWKQNALNTAISGLQDPDTHVCYRFKLQRRVCGLQRELHVTKKDQLEFSYCTLREPTVRVISAYRVTTPSVGAQVVYLDGANTLATVESFCLAQYAKDGWKGIHAESSILTTLFGLLFWDILFMDMPGAFESPYQTAPLDLESDSFYIQRKTAVDSRLCEIANDGYINIIEMTDTRERPKQTCCRGIRWEYPLKMLVEIADCIGGKGLAHIFRFFAEEYGHWTGGVPDLCLWKTDERKCMFVEVKSQNDRLSETQKIWLDLLIRAGVGAELCSVVDDNEIN